MPGLNQEPKFPQIVTPPVRGDTTLKADAELCTLLQNFSLRIQHRSARLLDAKAQLDSKIQRTHIAAEQASLDLTRAKTVKPLFFHITDDLDVSGGGSDDNNPTALCVSSNLVGHQVDAGDANKFEKVGKILGRNISGSGKREDLLNNDVQIIGPSFNNINAGAPYHNGSSPSGQNESAAIREEERIREEEHRAIADGIAALKYFHHTKSPRDEYYHSDHYFVLEEEEEDSSEEKRGCAEADLFNSRPLPFIIGSKDFMESQDGGIGSEHEHEHDHGVDTDAISVPSQ